MEWKNDVGLDDLINSIIDEIKANGGRFIDRDNSASPWYIVDDAKARRKIIQTLRQIRALERKDEVRSIK